jgi:ketosteroid isomerase-like protein
MEPKRAEDALIRIAESYFAGLARRDMSAVPYADDVQLRAPLNPNGGSTVPYTGKAEVLAYFQPILPNLGEIRVIRHFVGQDWVATRADVGLANGKVLRVLDAFHVRDGKIVEQENHYDPRPALEP